MSAPQVPRAPPQLRVSDGQISPANNSGLLSSVSPELAKREVASVDSTQSLERLRRLVPVSAAGKPGDESKEKDSAKDGAKDGVKGGDKGGQGGEPEQGKSEVNDRKLRKRSSGSSEVNTALKEVSGDSKDNRKTQDSKPSDDTTERQNQDDDGQSQNGRASSWYRWAWTSGPPAPQASERTWFSMWWRSDGSSDVVKGDQGEPEKRDENDDRQSEQAGEEDQQQQRQQSQDQSRDDDINKMAGPGGNRSWAFWSRSSGKSGQLAISGTETQDHPRNAERFETSDDSDGGSIHRGSKPKSGSKAGKDSKDTSTKDAKDKSTKDSKPRPKKKPARPNLVLPALADSCAEYSQSARFRTSFERWARYLKSGSNELQSQPPLFRTTPGRIHRVVVVGVHGYFPARVVRTILGEPTGTSVKFANMAAEAVERWAARQGFTVEVERIALEGEGRVLHRVETLYRLLSNWFDLISSADFVFFAAHSQGTPVAAHILARLVQEGRVDSARLALLGMAGVCLGPMSGLDKKLVLKAYSSLESEMLSELFEFQRVDSFQSRKFVDSLRTVIAHDAKVVLVGSLDDQLVPLYSSTCTHISHPNVYRAVYIDGQDVAPEFIAELVSLALRLRNVGAPDHGLVREISAAVSGALTGRGHSRIYNESAVYDLALEFALETTSLPSQLPLHVDSDFRIPKPNDNPYLLPWSMRGLVSEALARDESFAEQLSRLYSEFDNWEPESKVLRDVKYRLSAIQSKL